MIYFNKKIKSIAITDGPLESFSFLNYFILIKSKKFINYLKFPLLYALHKQFKLDYSFTYFKHRKYLFSKQVIENKNFQIKNFIKKKIFKNKIHILVVEDPTKTISLKEIILKYKLRNKKFCTIGRQGIFRIGTKIQKNISILPEVLLSSGIIKKVYIYPQSGVYNFAKLKKIKVVKLPEKVFNFDGCARMFENYILKKHKEIV